MRLLIVEDEPKTGDYLKKGLTEHGYSVEVARRPVENRWANRGQHFCNGLSG